MLSSSPLPRFPVWELPEVILYHIVGFVAPPTHRANILCHRVAILCQAARKTILEDERSVSLWGAVLTGDYGIDRSASVDQKQRRSCKRLRRSPCHQVRDAHKRMIDNTEISFFYLSELAHKSSRKIKEGLTKQRLASILDEFGPHLRFNNPVSSGGTYLVEVCRARHVKEQAILKCVEELVENRGSLLDIHTREAKNSNLTALCVAAVRGMPTVVGYLLNRGASKLEQCSGRFRLSTNARKSVQCTAATPLEFATTMFTSEQEQGATHAELGNLKKCINLLT